MVAGRKRRERNRSHHRKAICGEQRWEYPGVPGMASKEYRKRSRSEVMYNAPRVTLSPST
jgi:hypothetical protein